MTDPNHHERDKPCPIDLSQRVSPYPFSVKLRLVIWWVIRRVLFRPSFHTANRFRCIILRVFGAKIGRCVVIGPTVYITHPWNIIIGDHSQIGDYVWLYSLDTITIGANAIVSQRSFLCTGSHDYSSRTLPVITGKIQIADGAWICANTFMGPDVSVGRGTVVGASSSVVRDLPSMMVCHGSPCKPVKPRVIQD